jgi:hypothetical protein
MPGGLPKRELAASLSETRWGRCAVIKQGARTDAPLFPWSWNPHLSVALADGVCCYRAGMEYAHGGLSLQECMTLDLTIAAADTDATNAPTKVDIQFYADAARALSRKITPGSCLPGVIL